MTEQYYTRLLNVHMDKRHDVSTVREVAKDVRLRKNREFPYTFLPQLNHPETYFYSFYFYSSITDIPSGKRTCSANPSEKKKKASRVIFYYAFVIVFYAHIIRTQLRATFLVKMIMKCVTRHVRILYGRPETIYIDQKQATRSQFFESRSVRNEEKKLI